MRTSPGLKLTKEERAIQRDLEQGRYVPVPVSEHAKYRRAAKEYFRRNPKAKKDARINIRLSPDVLELFRQRAEREGLPYQSLLASLVFKYVNGSLVDIGNVAAIRRALRAG
jgi:predicted DNA binding CopG/RHH family protein